MSGATHTLDLSVGDVHQTAPTGAGKEKKNAMPTSPATFLDYPSVFALPSERKYPLHDAASVQASETSIEKDKTDGKLDEAKYGQAKRRVARAARKHGVASKFAKKPVTGGIAVRAHIARGGELHVRHMSDLGSISCRIPLAIADHAKTAGEAGKPVWIQLAKVGHFRGHHQGVFDFNTRVFDDLIRNFKEVDGGKVAFDFEHFSELPPEKRAHVQGQAEAQGIIHDLKASGSALFALVEWLEPARSLILAKKYWAVSPAINFKAVHPETGKPIGARLTSAALTNAPFLRSMVDVIAASSRTAEDVKTNGGGDVLVLIEVDGGAFFSAQAYSANEIMPRLRGALKMPELATPKELSEQLDRLRANFDAAGGNAGATHQGVTLSEYLLPLRDIAAAGNLSATWDQILDAVDSYIDAAMDEAECTGGITATTQEPEGVQEFTMAEKDLAVELGQAKSDLGQAKTELAAANTQVATLTLTANGASTKVSTLETDLATAKAELKTLRDKVSEFEKRTLSERIEIAMADHKDSQKLTENHRPMMLLTLQNDPTQFEKIYPPIKRENRHLTQRITPTAPKTEPTKFTATGAEGAEGGDDDVATSVEELTEQIMLSSKCSYEEAANQATIAFAGGT